MKRETKEHQLFDTSRLGDIFSNLDNLQQMEVIPYVNERETDEFKAWIAQRLGKITGSRFGEVNKLKVARGGKQKGDWSLTSETYLYEILSEYSTGLPAKDFTSKATDWGIKNEPLAIAAYEKLRGVEVEKLGFQQLTKYIGCTVDGKVKRHNGVIEVKCPFNSAVHIRNIDKDIVPDDYLPQVLGHLLVTKADWCDFISYDPRAKLERNKIHVVRIEREKVIHEINELEETLREFEILLISKIKKLKL
jgi:hypothetical protein